MKTLLELLKSTLLLSVSLLCSPAHGAVPEVGQCEWSWWTGEKAKIVWGIDEEASNPSVSAVLTLMGREYRSESSRVRTYGQDGVDGWQIFLKFSGRAGPPLLDNATGLEVVVNYALFLDGAKFVDMRFLADRVGDTTSATAQDTECDF